MENIVFKIESSEPERTPSPEVLEVEPATMEKIVLKEFILKYEALPELWDNFSQHYQNSIRRGVALSKLLNIYKKIKSDATVDDVKKKINSIRSNFRRECNKLEEYKRSRGHSGVVYKPRSWTFHLLTFLKRKGQPLAQCTSTGSAEYSESEGQHRDKLGRFSSLSPPPKRWKQIISEQDELEDKICSSFSPHSVNASLDQTPSFLPQPVNESLDQTPSFLPQPANASLDQIHSFLPQPVNAPSDQTHSFLPRPVAPLDQTHSNVPQPVNALSNQTHSFLTRPVKAPLDQTHPFVPRPVNSPLDQTHSFLPRPVNAPLDQTHSYLSQSVNAPSTVHTLTPTALYWSHKLDNLNRTQRLYAEKYINEILLEAELGNLGRNSVVINPSDEIETPKPSAVYSVCHSTPSSSEK